MSRTKTLVLTGIPWALVLCLACANTYHAQAKGDDEEQIKDMSLIPAPTRAAAEKLCGAANVKSVSREKQGNVWCYEYEFSSDGTKASAVFTESGALLELEQAIQVGALPKAVGDSIAQHMPGATIEKAETIERHLYEVAVKSGDKHKHLEISASGEVQGGDEQDEEDEEHEEHEHKEKQ